MGKIKLSVIMANYNYGHWLKQALDAICTQSYTPYEFIIMDDGSTDNSLDILKEYEGKYGFIKVIKNEKNMGSAWCAFELLQKTTGTHIYAAASDDYILPDFFATAVTLLQENPTAGLFFCDGYLLGKKCSPINKQVADTQIPIEVRDVVPLFQRFAFTPILANTVVINKRALLDAGCYRVALDCGCDTFAHTIVMLRKGACYDPRPLCVFRLHDKQYGQRLVLDRESNKKLITDLLTVITEPMYGDVIHKFNMLLPVTNQLNDLKEVVDENKEFQHLKLVSEYKLKAWTAGELL